MKPGNVGPLVADPLHAVFTFDAEKTPKRELGQTMVTLFLARLRRGSRLNV